MEKGKQTYKLPEGWSFAAIDEVIDYSTGLFKDGDWIESKDQDPTFFPFGKNPFGESKVQSSKNIVNMLSLMAF